MNPPNTSSSTKRTVLGAGVIVWKKLTSTWTYYPPGSPAESMGRLMHHARYDGYESTHTYGLHQSSVTTPYAGSVDGKTTTTQWNPVTRTRTVTVTVGGNILSQTSTQHSGSTTIRTVQTGGDPLVTTTHYMPANATFGGRPMRVLHPDGTLTTYGYEFTTSGGLKTTVRNGSTEDDETVEKGTQTVTITNSRGTTILREVTAIGYGTGNAVFESMAVTTVDHLGRALITAYFPESADVVGEVATATNPAWTTEVEYSCCGIAKETDRHGIETYHAYDHLQRRIKTNRLGVTTETHHLGLTTETYRYPESVQGELDSILDAAATDLVSRSVRNLAGTLQESWSPDPTSTTAGALVKSSTTTTTYAPAPGLSRRTVTTTPDNFSQTTDSFLDGRTATTTGDLSPAMVYQYSVNETGEFTKQAHVSQVRQYSQKILTSTAFPINSARAGWRSRFLSAADG